MMNGYHVISEMLLILCFKIIYEIEQCNIQILSNSSQGIDSNIVAKKVTNSLLFRISNNLIF